jgi:glycosyltransferase involved in cell wall biosynthesis/predicted  nucleic acid-binding Zn-ribbon protein
MIAFDLPSLKGIHPRRFGLVSWSSHVPFGYDLVAELRPRVLVELGAHSGESYFAFCQSVRENQTATTCYAVDTWRGDPQAGFYGEDIYREVERHNREFYPDFSYLVRSTFDEALAGFADGSIDLLHIDGLHTYQAVKHDFEAWLPKVSETGVILFHDIAARHADFGAWKLWEEIARPQGSFAFHQGWGLGVWQKQPGVPPASEFLRALFSGDAAQAETIRRYYAMASDTLRLRKENARLLRLAPPNLAAQDTVNPSEENVKEGDLFLQVYFPQGGVYCEETSVNFRLSPNHWTKLAMTLPTNWKGEGLRIDPLPGVGLIEIASVRIASTLFGETVWQRKGRKELEVMRIAGTASLVPNTRFLSLLSDGGDPQVLAPALDLGDFDEPLKLEIIVRVRTALSACVSSLKVWAGLAGSLPGHLEEKESLQKSLAQLREEITAASRERSRLEAELNAAHASLTDFETQQALTATHIENIERAVRVTAEALEIARAEAGQGRAEAEQWRVKTEAAQAEAEQWRVKTEAAQAERDAARAQAERAQIEIQALQSQGANARETLLAAQEELVDAKAETRELRAEKSESQREVEALQLEVSGLHAELAARAKALDDTRQELHQTHLRLRDIDQAFLAAREQRDADRGRVQSMQHSLSWKLTLPLRAAQRALIGQSHSSNNGQREPEARPAPQPPATDDEDSAAAAAAGAEPSAYIFHLDAPTDWNLPEQTVRVRGWCLPKNPGNGKIAAVRLRCGERTVMAECKLPRPDVAAMHGKEAMLQGGGFEADLRLPGGPSEVMLEALEESGQIQPLARFHARAPYASRGWRKATGDPALDYAGWVVSYDTLNAETRRRIRARARALDRQPLISVILPVYNTPEVWLSKAIESVRRQLYPHWELCIADDASTKPHVRRTLEKFQEQDSRIKVCWREANGHISAASNSALDLAQGEFVALLDHDDELAPHALYAVAAELNAHPEADLIYSDEDKIDEQGQRFSPYFKPDWNPDLFLGQNYLCHLLVYRTECVREAGGFRTGVEGCQDWDLALRVIERIPAGHIRHIPRVLYHWRAISGSTALALEEKTYIRDSAARVLQEHCERTGMNAVMEAVPGGHWRLRHALPDPPPLISIIIPTRNHLEVLRRGVESVLAQSTYPHYEIIIVDNQSDDPDTLEYLAEPGDERIRVLRYDSAFNYSAINNFAVARARGELVCLLNNDMETLTADWMEEMAGHALRPEIGAVGAMLYYPNDTIQHAGCVLGIGGVAGHAFKTFPRGTDGQFNRARLVQNYTAVTAACLMIRKNTFEQVGGLEEKRLRVGFNDIDFCLRVHRAGYRNLWTPFAEFYHHESISRGLEDTPEKHHRFQAEVAYMRERWAETLDHDPAYNPNLTLLHEDFSLAWPPQTPELVPAAVTLSTRPKPG